MSGVLIASYGGASAQRFECSRAGCRAVAHWAIQWRNPKIHELGRHKTWLACDEHLDYLRDFLSARSFPVDVLPVSSLKTDEASRGDQAGELK